jgi:hypothetical protein
MRSLPTNRTLLPKPSIARLPLAGAALPANDTCYSLEVDSYEIDGQKKNNLLSDVKNVQGRSPIESGAHEAFLATTNSTTPDPRDSILDEA